MANLPNNESPDASMSAEIPSLFRLSSLCLAKSIASWEALEQGFSGVAVNAVRSVERENEAELREAEAVRHSSNILFTRYNSPPEGYSSPPEGWECPYCPYQRELLDMYRKGLFAIWSCKNCSYSYPLVTGPYAACPPNSGFCQGSNHQQYRSQHKWGQAGNYIWDRVRNGVYSSPLPPPCWVVNVRNNNNRCYFQDLPKRVRDTLFLCAE